MIYSIAVILIIFAPYTLYTNIKISKDTIVSTTDTIVKIIKVIVVIVLSIFGYLSDIIFDSDSMFVIVIRAIAINFIIFLTGHLLLWH